MIALALGFSALQRAENSSNVPRARRPLARMGFSALQRAENSSNAVGGPAFVVSSSGFSALQRAENSSNFRVRPAHHLRAAVSVLFSEPKIPQSCWLRRFRGASRVSVLFSEPKIPQIETEMLLAVLDDCFSALQRAENSSNVRSCVGEIVRSNGFSALQRAENSSNARLFADEMRAAMFQCSSASRKFLKQSLSGEATGTGTVSVLFSEPKIPQSEDRSAAPVEQRGFSALQRAENSSNGR